MSLYPLNVKCSLHLVKPRSLRFSWQSSQENHMISTVNCLQLWYSWTCCTSAARLLFSSIMQTLYKNCSSYSVISKDKKIRDKRYLMKITINIESRSSQRWSKWFAWFRRSGDLNILYCGFLSFLVSREHGSLDIFICIGRILTDGNVVLHVFLNNSLFFVSPFTYFDWIY